MGEDEQEAGAPWPVPGATTTSTEGEKLIWHERWGWQSQDDIIADQRAEIEALKAENKALRAELEALKQPKPRAPRALPNLPECSGPGCPKMLKGMWLTSGLGLCKSCLPSKCAEEGCEKRLLHSWRFVGKCKFHGGYEGLPK